VLWTIFSPGRGVKQFLSTSFGGRSIIENFQFGVNWTDGMIITRLSTPDFGAVAGPAAGANRLARTHDAIALPVTPRFPVHSSFLQWRGVMKRLQLPAQSRRKSFLW
jgi:hypothetical protein